MTWGKYLLIVFFSSFVASTIVIIIKGGEIIKLIHAISFGGTILFSILSSIKRHSLNSKKE